MQDISWDDLRLLLSIAREGSIRKASASLDLAPSTLSRRIATLEGEIGSTLMIRLGDGVMLTPAGLHVHAIASDMEQRFVSVAMIRNAMSDARGLVRCAVTEGIGTYWILPQLPQFRRDHPNTAVKLTCTMSSTDVMRLEAELAIQYDKPEHPDLICVKLARIHFSLFASQAYLRQAGAPASIDDLRRHTLVDQFSAEAPAGVLADLLGEPDAQDRIAFLTNTSSAHFYAVDTGLGIGLLPTFATPLGADLEPLDLDIRLSSDLWLAYHPDLRDDPKIMAFVAWLRRLFDPAQHPCFGEIYVSPRDLATMATHVAPSQVNAVTHAGRYIRRE